jgi:hypothetical protein
MRTRSHRTWTGLAVLVTGLALLGLVGADTLARRAQPPHDAAPGAVGVTGPVLGSIDPVVAPGFRLEVGVTE